MSDSRNSLVVVGGGQSGLAAAAAAQAQGIRPIVLEAGPRPAGSWPRYYESLTLFSPAEFSSIDGTSMIGSDPDCYPKRDDVADYLTSYAETLGVEVRTGVRVTDIQQCDGRFALDTTAGTLEAGGVVAASGSFDNPVRPHLPGADTFAGEILHVADYRNPERFAGRRVVVVGGGNSAVQVAYELGKVARVSLATRAPITWMPQRHDGKDMHYWLRETGFDDLPPAWLAQLLSRLTGPLVVDDGTYGRAEADGVYDHRTMFTAFDDKDVVWSDGTREQVDAVVWGTGYRPHLPYLAGLGALDEHGMPRHDGGISTTHPGLAYVGLEFQRSFSSNTLRGARRDADHVLRSLAAHLGDAAKVLTF